MKKTKFYLFAAAALTMTMAACSNDGNLGINDKPINGDTSYAKVKISMGSIFGSRAFDDDNKFDNGTAAEAKIEKLTILLFDKDGNMVGTGNTSDISYSRPDDYDNKNESVSDTKGGNIIQISIIPGSATPTQLLAFVNKDANYETIDQALSDLTADVKNGSLFVMTNSGYYGTDGKYQVATAIDPEAIYKTMEAAADEEAKTIDIYVERLAAKLTVKEKEGKLQDEDCTAEVVLYGVDGTTKYSIIFDHSNAKWAPTATADQMYMMKQGWGETNSLGWAQPSDVNYRSFWAKGKYYGSSDCTYKDFAEGTILDYLSAAEIVNTKDGKGKAFGTTDYIREHTYGSDVIPEGDAEFIPSFVSTSAIVIGQYKVYDSNGSLSSNFKNKDNYDFYLSIRGFEDGKKSWTIYSENDLISRLYTLSEKEAYTSATSDTKITAETAPLYFTLQKVDNKYRLAKGSNPVYIGGTEVAQDKYTEEFKGESSARHYRNGWAYFFVPIAHKGLGTETLPNVEVGTFGVVRNHSYNLTINQIKGLGAPLDESKVGNDPTDPDDPTKPQPDVPVKPDPDDIKDAVINAVLNVLSWHNTNQSVDL